MPRSGSSEEPGEELVHSVEHKPTHGGQPHDQSLIVHQNTPVPRLQLQVDDIEVFVRP